jgi:hypothetical protein
VVENRDDVRPPSGYDQLNVEGARNVWTTVDAGVSIILSSQVRWQSMACKMASRTRFDTSKLEAGGFTRPSSLQNGLFEMISHDFGRQRQMLPERREDGG